MKSPEQLSHEELAEVVRTLTFQMYAEYDEKDVLRWKPDRKWTREVLEHVASTLYEAGLVPEEEDAGKECEDSSNPRHVCDDDCRSFGCKPNERGTL